MAFKRWDPLDSPVICLPHYGPRGPDYNKQPEDKLKKQRYVEGFLPTPGDFYKNRILIKIGFKPTFKPSKTVPDHVKLSFLSAALDPQEMVQRY